MFSCNGRDYCNPIRSNPLLPDLGHGWAMAEQDYPSCEREWSRGNFLRQRAKFVQAEQLISCWLPSWMQESLVKLSSLIIRSLSWAQELSFNNKYFVFKTTEPHSLLKGAVNTVFISTYCITKWRNHNGPNNQQWLCTASCCWQRYHFFFIYNLSICCFSCKMSKNNDKYPSQVTWVQMTSINCFLNLTSTRKTTKVPSRNREKEANVSDCEAVANVWKCNPADRHVDPINHFNTKINETSLLSLLFTTMFHSKLKTSVTTCLVKNGGVTTERWGCKHFSCKKQKCLALKTENISAHHHAGRRHRSLYRLCGESLNFTHYEFKFL